MRGGGHRDLYVINANRIDWSSHLFRRLKNRSDCRRILSERLTKVKQLALFGHPNPPRSAHSAFQFSLSLYQPQRFM
jgi:hypothetical protein